MSRQKRILVIRPDRIGDSVCATPLLRGLRITWPDAYIAMMVRPAIEPVIRNNPNLDSILIDDFEGADKGRAGFWRKVRELRALRFTHALILLPTERHTWMTFLAGIWRRTGVGTRPYHIMTMTKMVSRHKYIPLRHEADYSLDMGRAIGVKHDDLSVECFVTDAERRSAEAFLAGYGVDPNKPLVTVHPQTGGSAPNWLPERYAELVRTLLERDPDVQVAVIIAPGGAGLIRAFEGLDPQRVVFPDDKGDLRMLMAVLSLADVEVSASTGPMHLAAGLRTPSVNIFCPLPACSPTLWGPQGNQSSIIVQERQQCDAFCNNNPRTCHLEFISVHAAADAVMHRLARGRSDTKS